MTTIELTRKDFVSDQTVRWCPGCGDYSILAQMQKVMPELGIPREKIVFISGIGCSSRFPYYMNTYGIHSIHGRAPTLATGLAIANPELTIFVITGDGDMLMGLGSLATIAVQRPPNLAVIVFDNGVYGETGMQPSHTMGTPGSISLMRLTTSRPSMPGILMSVKTRAGCSRLNRSMPALPFSARRCVVG